MILLATAIGGFIGGALSSWYISNCDKEEKIKALQEVIKRMRSERKEFEAKYEAMRHANAKAAAYFRLRAEKLAETMKDLQEQVRDLKKD